MKEAFLQTYDRCADDIFAYCYDNVAHKEVAKYLTRNIFTATWDSVVHDNVTNIERTLNKIAKEHIKNFLSYRNYHVTYQDKLWNLTLSQ